jgi:hypothetical protein
VSDQSEWLGITFSVPMYITGEGEPYRPEAVMFFDAGTSSVLGYELVHPVDAAAQAATVFRATTKAPLVGAPRAPTRLRVPSSELAEALRAELSDLEIVVAPTPELEGVVAALLHQLTAEEDDGDDKQVLTLLPRGVTADDVSAFFTAASRLYTLEPWNAVPVGGFVGISCRALGIGEGALFVVGQSELPRGFSMFWTHDDVIAYAENMDASERGEEIDAIPQHVIFNYEQRSDYPTPLLDQVEMHGFPVASEDAYPRTMVVDSDVVGRPLTKEELNGLTVVIQALAKLVENPALAGAWDSGETVTARSSAGNVVAEASAPLPELSDRIAELSPLHRRAEAFLEELATTMPDGEPFSWAGVTTSLAMRSLGALVHELSAEQLLELVFVTVPAEIMCEPAQASDVIAGIKALLAHGQAHELEKALPADATEKLEQRLGDAAAFGPEKALFMAGTWAGYDMTTEDGITEFLAVQQAVGTQAMNQAREAMLARKKR